MEKVFCNIFQLGWLSLGVLVAPNNNRAKRIAIGNRWERTESKKKQAAETQRNIQIKCSPAWRSWVDDDVDDRRPPPPGLIQTLKSDLLFFLSELAG